MNIDGKWKVSLTSHQTNNNTAGLGKSSGRVSHFLLQIDIGELTQITKSCT